MLVVGVLLLREPDFGAFVVIAVIAMGILFLGGVNWRLFAGADRACWRSGFVAADLASPYRMQRIFGFLDPVGRPATARATSSRTR